MASEPLLTLVCSRPGTALNWTGPGGAVLVGI